MINLHMSRFLVVKCGEKNNQGSFYVLVDEVRYAYVDEYYANSDSNPAGPATMNIALTAGQVVRIENDGSTALYGTNSASYIYSWFTGHLLYPL